MPWDELKGQERAVHQLRQGLARGQPHHAYLLAGPAGVGKELLARLFAQAANCEADPPQRPCGACAACKAIARGTFPDVLVVRPQANLVARGQVGKGDLDGAPSKEIRVDEVRQLAKRLSLAAATGRRKVAILEPADALNERAQNALLKTLEEPPPATTFVLVTSQPDVLLPTVRSRCQRLQLAPLSVAVIEAELLRGGVPAAEARDRAVRAEGSLGRALSLSGKDVEQEEAAVKAAVAALAAADEREALDVAEAYGERGAAQGLAEAVRGHVRGLLVSRARSGEEGPAPLHLFAQHDLCDRVVDALEQNGNGRLQLERLLLGLRGLGGKGA